MDDELDGSKLIGFCVLREKVTPASVLRVISEMRSLTRLVEARGNSSYP
jgi:hypothetical protein